MIRFNSFDALEKLLGVFNILGYYAPLCNYREEFKRNNMVQHIFNYGAEIVTNKKQVRITFYTASHKEMYEILLEKES